MKNVNSDKDVLDSTIKKKKVFTTIITLPITDWGILLAK